MADNTLNESKGLLSSLTMLAATLVNIAHTRLELLSNDLEQDRERLFLLIGLYLVAMFCIVVGLVITIILIVFVLWNSHRLTALFSIAGFFIAIGLAAWAYARHKAKTKPKLFLSSLLELVKDQKQLDSD